MTTLARLASTGLIVDLANLTPSQFQIMTDLRNGGTPKGELECIEHGGPMYIRAQGNSLCACHWPGSGIEGKHSIAAESDEHRRQKDYTVRAADGHGLSAELEKTIGHGIGRVTRPDVLVAERFPWEIQHSHLTARAAKSRTTRQMRAGLAPPVWCDDSDGRAVWANQVPHVTYSHGWSALPPRNSVYLTSLKRVTSIRCAPGNFDHCPNRRGGWCRDWHPAIEPLMGQTFDYTVGAVAAGEIVSVRFGSGIVLTTSSDARRYGELVGRDMRFQLEHAQLPTTPPTQADETRKCQAERPEVEVRSWERVERCFHCGADLPVRKFPFGYCSTRCMQAIRRPRTENEK